MRLPAAALLALAAMTTQAADKEHVHDDGVATMTQAHASDLPTATPITERALPQPVKADYLDYFAVGDKAVSGYFAEPRQASAKAALPGLIVIHEWWGLNANVEAMTRQLAAQGYRVLAVDLYNGARAKSPEEAGPLAKAASADPAAMISNIQAAHALLKAKGAGKIGTLGWCFGGAQSLQATLAMPDSIDATVIYYGKLETDPIKLAKLRKPVLGIFGGEDKGIPVEGVRTFELTLLALGVPVDINVYAGVGHAFANPSGKNYVAAAAEDAWLRTTRFLAAKLK